jgi:aminodeoxyfutalosine synthase
MVTPFLSQIALEFGCDDVEGTVVYERVYHDAGAQTPMMMSYGELVRFIRAAGKEPVERDSLYDTVRTFADDDVPADPGSRGQGGSVPDLTSLVGTGRV